MALDQETEQELKRRAFNNALGPGFIIGGIVGVLFAFLAFDKGNGGAGFITLLIAPGLFFFSYLGKLAKLREAAEKTAKKKAEAKLKREKDAERLAEEKAREQREAEEWAAGAPEREASAKEKARAEAEEQRIEDEKIEQMITARRARIDRLKAHLDADLA